MPNIHTHMDVINEALGEYILVCNRQIHSARDDGNVDSYLYWKREFDLAEQSRDMLIKRSS